MATMDTLVFGLILGTLVAVYRSGRRTLVLPLFLVSLVAVLAVFNHHVTSALKLNF